MGLLGKKKKKYSFSLSIDSLTLGAGEGQLVISWERGKRSGTTAAAAPAGGAAASYHFTHQPIVIPATLYKVRASLTPGSERLRPPVTDPAPAARLARLTRALAACRLGRATSARRCC